MQISLLQYTKQLEFDKIATIVSEYAVSPEAKNRIINIIPSDDYYEVTELIDMTDSIYQLLQSNRIPTISASDGIVEICIRASKGGMLSMGELLKIKTILKNADSLSSWYTASSEPRITDEMFFMLYSDIHLEGDISHSILSETEMSDEASAELASIRRKIKQAENSIRDRLESIIRSDTTKKMLQDAIITMRNGRFVVPVKTESRGALKGLVHDVSQSGATYFIEPDTVVEANNRIMELMSDEAREIERILFSFSDRVAQVSLRITESYKSYISIDILLAKAKYALQIQATRPNINKEGYLNLKKARHPLIAKEKVVPIDISLGDNYRILVITGPNTGGKTVTLKTVGLLSLMAMSGILLPVTSNSDICIFDSIYADVGDEQSIEQNLSTFSGHITNIVKILRTATKDSLVLLDELGAGTDPAEGAALAIAILDRLHNIGCNAIATTHYGEIKAFAIETKGIENASCEFNLDTLQPTYHLLMGIPGSSNALAIAQRLGIDERIIKVAQDNISSENRQFEDVLKEMEKLRIDISEREILSQKLLDHAEQVLIEADIEAKRIANESNKEYERARTKSRQMSADVEAEAQRLLEEMRSLRDPDSERRDVIQRAREIARKDSRNLIRASQEVTNNNYEDLPFPEELYIGQTLFITTLGHTGQIIALPDENDNVLIKTGNIRTRVPKSTLRQLPTENSNKTKGKGNTNTDVASERSSKNEINLLGKTVDEAILETDRFIDQAMFSKFTTIYIIHGKGTGRLRSALQQHLKTKKEVKSFRLGGYGEGDSGVTVVELERGNR